MTRWVGEIPAFARMTRAVIPAKAGIFYGFTQCQEIPAFAGMTDVSEDDDGFAGMICFLDSQSNIRHIVTILL